MALAAPLLLPPISAGTALAIGAGTTAISFLGLYASDESFREDVNTSAGEAIQAVMQNRPDLAKSSLTNVKQSLMTAETHGETGAAAEEPRTDIEETITVNGKEVTEDGMKDLSLGDREALQKELDNLADEIAGDTNEVPLDGTDTYTRDYSHADD